MDPGSPSALVRILAPKVPLIFKSTLLQSFGISRYSSKWNLQTELTVLILRSIFVKGNYSLTELQEATTKDPGAKGRLWISRETFPPPEEDDVKQLLLKVIDETKQGQETCTIPSALAISGEWTGHRANVSKDAPEPKITEAAKYDHLMKETTSNVTILYFHGGAYYMCDPATHRLPTMKLARRTGGRIFSVRYRLAPQYPFPAALLDGLISYLSLLYPPRGSFHEPVPAAHIVFCGDSAGGNLSFALLQVLLHLHRNTPKGQLPRVKFNGQEVELPLPAGVAGNSPWLDLTHSMPSCEQNARYDYIPSASRLYRKEWPNCMIWPAQPTRAHIFCEGRTLTHPLVSPIRATSWEGSPPLLFMVGEEVLMDDSKLVAQQAAKEGVPVVWEQYEAMPHCFALILAGLKSTKMCFDTWARFCSAAVHDPRSIETQGHWISARKLERVEVDPRQLSDITPEDVRLRTDETVETVLKAREMKEGSPKL